MLLARPWRRQRAIAFSSHRIRIMSDRTLHLLKSRRFLPLFVTQFLGAFNDNLFKNALVMLILFRLAEGRGRAGQTGDRKSGVEGKRGSGRVNLGGSRIISKKI